MSANKDSSDFRLEYSTPENEYYPRYSPDGQFLAFPKATFHPTRADEIFVWHKILDNLIQITDSTPVAGEWGPEWSPFNNAPTWPSVGLDSAQLVSGDSISIDINVDADTLSFGRHTASVMIHNAANNILLTVVPVNLFYEQASDVQVGSRLPSTYSLAQNYPNPFNPTSTDQIPNTRIKFCYT